jgi:phospholipid/cholesterol/gamma-HCH transport system substrate-binding protein
LRISTETIVGMFILAALTVFLFMSFKIGVWRLDAVKYAHYITYFSDVSGLNEKADVVISGVKVGWVSKLSLVSKYRQVRVDIMIERSSSLHSNAYGIIKQNGLLGTKYVEIFPGDPSLPILANGSTLMRPNKPPVSIDDLLSTFKEIADNVNQVTGSIKKALGEEEGGVSKINNVLTKAQKAFDSIESAANSMGTVFNTNSEKLNKLIDNLEEVSSGLKNSIPQTLDSLRRGADSFEKNFGEVSESFKKTIDPITEAAEKIHSGKGVIGALINDEKMLKEVKTAVHGIRHYFEYVDRLKIDFDMHMESMHGRGNDLDFKDAKGIVNLLIRPSEDFYYLAGVTSSYGGVVKRYRTDRRWLDEQKNEIVPSTILANDINAPWAKLKYAPVKEKYIRHYDAITFNLQLGRSVGNLNMRAGLFENSFGIGLDYNIPLQDDARWITTFEMYKFYDFFSHTLDGRMKFDYDRPHLKWLNRVYFNDSLYFAFGADDFISRYNKNFFVGFGLSFENDDIKYLAPKINF